MRITEFSNNPPLVELTRGNNKQDDEKMNQRIQATYTSLKKQEQNFNNLSPEDQDKLKSSINKILAIGKKRNLQLIVGKNPQQSNIDNVFDKMGKEMKLGEESKLTELTWEPQDKFKGVASTNNRDTGPGINNRNLAKKKKNAVALANKQKLDTVNKKKAMAKHNDNYDDGLPNY